MSALDTSTDTTTDTSILPFEDVDDPEHRAHYIRPFDNVHITGPDMSMSAQDIADTARLLGVEVVALCEFRWVPKADPRKYPVCEACVEVGVQINLGNRQ